MDQDDIEDGGGVLADVAINREERAFCDDGGVD